MPLYRVTRDGSATLHEGDALFDAMESATESWVVLEAESVDQARERAGIVFSVHDGDRTAPSARAEGPPEEFASVGDREVYSYVVTLDGVTPSSALPRPRMRYGATSKTDAALGGW